ncbi:hypothetical protein WV31_10980 [Magnetospirillum sp. ME-1]|nr:hypothetical protein WV31_10980 [Magnetospirillum sp. ME-1]
MTPYAEALHWIKAKPGTGSAETLAKLVLSIWNSDCAFSFRECIANLDPERTALAVRVAAHFAEVGEDDELVEIGHAVCALYPRLWDLGEAADEAKTALRRRWMQEA